MTLSYVLTRRGLTRLESCHPAVEGERDYPLESEEGRGIVVLCLLPPAVRHLYCVGGDARECGRVGW